jgi:two-component system CheB/CheR fusion protein
VVSGLAGGADGYLAYPVSEAALLAVVNSLLRSRELEAIIQQQNQQLRKKDRHKDQLLAMVAHEIRNPLTAILNASRILRAEGAKTAKREWVAGLVERQTRQLVRLTDDLLDLSRIDRGKLLLRKTPFDLAGLIETAAGDYLSMVKAAGLTLHLELPRRPVWVNADASRLTQVVSNLVHNSIKFTDPGGRILISLSEEKMRCQAVLVVQDTGIGIEPEMLPGLFGIFTQAEQSRNRKETGLGLGLALVKGLVELHGGRVQGASQGLGKGSSFVVRFPLTSEERTTKGGANQDSGISSDSPPRRILVVDDNHSSAAAVSHLLEAKGHEVRVALDGPAALNTALAFLPDVVFLDIGLPGMNGYEVARRLRNQSGLPNLFLVALTGYGGDEVHRLSREAGFDEHLTKPVDLEALHELLGRHPFGL